MPKAPTGMYEGGITDPKIAELVGRTIAILPHVEERMIEVMALLLGGRFAPARQVFRALNSEDARVKVMRALLEQARHNNNKGPEFDEIIDLFVEIKKRRNAYAHGLWHTHQSGRSFLEEPTTVEFEGFLLKREIKLSEINSTVERVNQFFAKVTFVTHPHLYDEHGQLKPFPETLESPPPEETG